MGFTPWSVGTTAIFDALLVDCRDHEYIYLHISETIYQSSLLTLSMMAAYSIFIGLGKVTLWSAIALPTIYFMFPYIAGIICIDIHPSSHSSNPPKQLPFFTRHISSMEAVGEGRQSVLQKRLGDLIMSETRTKSRSGT
jgi:hypothetical protein